MNSGLAQDPEKATYTLILAATQHVSDALVALGSMNEHAIGSAVKGYLGGDDRIALTIYGESVRQSLSNLGAELQWTSQEAKTNVLPVLDAVNRDFGAFRDTVNNRLVNAEKMDITAAQVFDAGVPAMRALQELSRVSYAEMNARSSSAPRMPR